MQVARLPGDSLCGNITRNWNTPGRYQLLSPHDKCPEKMSNLKQQVTLQCISFRYFKKIAK